MKGKDSESGEDSGTAGAPGEIAAGLDSSFVLACRSRMRLADSRQRLAQLWSPGPFKEAGSREGEEGSGRGEHRAGGGGGGNGGRVPLSAPCCLAHSSRAESEGGDSDPAQEPWNFSEK